VPVHKINVCFQFESQAPHYHAGLWDVTVEELLCFEVGFLEEFNAEVADAEGLEGGEVGGEVLRGSVEEGVAAGVVGEEWVGFVHAVAECDLVFFAGAVAGAEIFSGGEGVGEDAVFGVEHGHVVVDDDFELGGVGVLEHGGELGEGEVVGGGEAGEAGVEEEGGGEFVGDVEGVVGDEREVGGFFFEEGKGGEVADEDGVGVGGEEFGEVVFFVWFEDAEGGEGDGEVGGAAALDGGGVVAGVFEVEVEQAKRIFDFRFLIFDYGFELVG